MSVEPCGWCDETGAVCQDCGSGPETCQCEDFLHVACGVCAGEAVVLP